MRGRIMTRGRWALVAGVLLGTGGVASANGIQGTYTIRDVGSHSDGTPARIDDSGKVNYIGRGSAGAYTIGRVQDPLVAYLTIGGYLHQAGSDVNLLPSSLQTAEGFSHITDLNSSGHVIGIGDGVSTNSDAFFFAPGSAGFVHLKALPGGGDDFTYASAINDKDQIVGYSGDKCVLWNSPTATPIDLATLIPSSSGWHLLSASGINNFGQIVGLGTLSGRVPDGTTFRLDPVPTPEPTTLAVIVSAGVLAAAFRVVRRSSPTIIGRGSTIA